MDDLFNIAVDEIALEGGEGVSLVNLWKLLEANPLTARFPLDDSTKAALLASLRRAPGLTFLPAPTGAQGSEAEVIVASEDLRRAALGCHAPMQTALSSLEQRTLELLGKARHKGMFQSTLATLLRQNCNAYHYVAKCLEIRGLLSRRNIICRPADSKRPGRLVSAFTRTYLLRLGRFTERTRVDTSKLFAAESSAAGDAAPTPSDAAGVGQAALVMSDPWGGRQHGVANPGLEGGMDHSTGGGGWLSAGDAMGEPLSRAVPGATKPMAHDGGEAAAGGNGGGGLSSQSKAGNTSGVGARGDAAGTWDVVRLPDWVPDAKARVCKQLRDAPGQVLLEKDVKSVFKFLGTGGHRNWRRLRAAMMHDGSIEHFVGSKKGKPVFCLRLKKDARQGAGPRGLLADKSLEEQAFDIVDAVGAKGIFLSEMWQKLGVRSKANRAILEGLIRRGLIIASMDHNGQIATRMLYSCRFPPQAWEANVGST
eukprot:jgi/Mesvir1/3850/Mv19815-RA.1